MNIRQIACDVYFAKRPPTRPLWSELNEEDRNIFLAIGEAVSAECAKQRPTKMGLPQEPTDKEVFDACRRSFDEGVEYAINLMERIERRNKE